MPFLERRRLVRRLESFIARGLDALAAGAAFPGDPVPGLSDWIAPCGRHLNLDLVVDVDRIERLAASRGVTFHELMSAAINLGARKAN